MRSKDVNMLSGSITKGLLTICIPVMIMNVVQSLFNIVDMTILKTFDTGDGLAVGAVGVCGVLITLCTCLVTGVATGANVVIAKNIGARNQEGVDRAVGSAMSFSVVGGLVLAVIGIFGAPLFLRWANCPDRLLSEAILYFRLYFTGVPILMVYNFCASILRSTGDSRRPMIYLTIGGVIKVAATFLFIGYFRMGVAGVGIATIVSWGFSAVLAVWALCHNTGAVKIKKQYLRFYKEELLRMLHIGIPTGVQQALYSVANIIISATVNSFGPEATTGISIANNYDGILYNISTATALAVMPYVSQNLGNGNVKRAMQSVWKGILITIALGASFGSLSAIFSTQLASIMSSDPVVIAYARQKMVIISSTYFICGINEIFGAALRGMGKPTSATVATLIFMCAIRFPWAYFVFPLLPSMTFLYLIWPIGWILSIITLMCVFFPTAKKLKIKAAVAAQLTE